VFTVVVRGAMGGGVGMTQASLLPDFRSKFLKKLFCVFFFFFVFLTSETDLAALSSLSSPAVLFRVLQRIPLLKVALLQTTMVKGVVSREAVLL